MTPVMLEHNLRSALAVIRGAAELMANPEASPQDWQAAAELMTQGLARLALVPGIDMDFWEGCELGRPAPLPQETEDLAETG